MLKQVYSSGGSFIAFTKSRGGKFFKIIIHSRVLVDPFSYDYEDCLSSPISEGGMRELINESKDTGVKLP